MNVKGIKKYAITITILISSVRPSFSRLSIKVSEELNLFVAQKIKIKII